MINQMMISRSIRQMLAVAVVELLRILRDRTSFSLIVVVPALQIILFGYAINLNPKNVSIAIAGGAPGTQETVVSLIGETGYFLRPQVFSTSGAAKAAVKKDGVDVAIELADSGDLFDALDVDGVSLDETKDGALTTTRVYADGANAAAIVPALAALEIAFQRRLLSALENDQERLPGVTRVWLFNPEIKTSWLILPGLIGVIAMIGMLMLGALSLVKEKEQGSFEALSVMPVSPYLVLTGKLTPYVAIALLQAVLALGACTVLFGLPVSGPVPVFLCGIILLACVHLMLGFVISSLVSSQIQALQAAVAFYLPSMLLSGFMFPFSGMPRWAQYIGEILPLTHFVRFSKDILLRGADATTSTLHLVPVVLMLIGVTVLAAAVYRRKLLHT